MINNDAKNFCNESLSLIENYDKAIADSNQTWHCHHRKGITTSKKDLIKKNEYYNRPASELIFLTKKEHISLHNKLKYVSSETRKKMSESQKGKNKGKTPWNKGKNLQEEYKQKIGAAFKNRHWFNNGIKNVFVKECPEGFARGRLKNNMHID